ncbi:hypothetical protein [Xanthomonas arboricola]|uniref:Uncharacterized protein n=1 Tax=Xanthomonas arboricola TaxID=56448 RepID=A0AAU9I0V6_9XANT|nr:hypothetical protein [Xanthomonas arboricola]CAE6837245.1 hypothetical protein XA1314C_37330 [Xanthomonas arboricola]CAE6837274.1 hypothetical protein XA1314C_37330 [Xanthomonas arboricola]
MDTSQIVEKLSEESGRASLRVTKVGLGLTAFYILSMLAYVFCTIDNVLEMDPNEFGDFLAGVFGPLALFWLVCGYFQQGVELRNNARALHLQALELQNSSEALKSQVKEMQASVEQQKEMARLASEQLSHNLELQRKQRFERNRSENPSFRITSVESYKSPAPGIGQVNLKNTGASVVIFSHHSNGDDAWNIKYGNFNTGDEIIFAPMREGRQDGTPVDAVVEFRCKSGRTGQLKIVYACDGSGFAYPEISTIFPDDDES